MAAYADVAAYRAVYDSDAADARIDAHLERASRKIDAALAARGAVVPEEPDEALSAALADVSIDMAHRVLGDSGGSQIGLPDGITSYSQTQGGFSESFSWATPYADMKVRQDELDWLLSLLGFDVSGFGTMRLGGA